MPSEKRPPKPSINRRAGRSAKDSTGDTVIRVDFKGVERNPPRIPTTPILRRWLDRGKIPPRDYSAGHCAEHHIPLANYR